MRVVLLIVVQLAVSVIAAVSALPVLVRFSPAIREDARLGIAAMAAIATAIAAGLAFVLPWRRRKQ
jgi:hypothetical protein